MELRKDDLFILLGLLVVVGGLMVGATTSKVFVNTNFGGNNISNISWVNASYSGSNSTWQHQTYPAACSDGYSITALGDSTTCTKFANTAPNLTEKNIEDMGFNIDAFNNSGVSNEGLVLEMPFDSSNYVNSSLTLDSSSQQNDGTVHGATFNSSGGIGSSGAYSFDGVNDYVSVARDSSIEPDYISISMWIKPLTWVNNDGILSKDHTAHSAPHYSYNILCLSTGLLTRFNLRNSTGTIICADLTGIQLNEWNHIVFTYDGSKIKGYRDGILNIESDWVSGPLGYSATDLLIGKLRNFGQPFNGSIGEVKIWDRSLSASEIQGLYEQKVKGRDSFGYRAKDNAWYGSQTIQQTETICLNGGACTQNISTNSTHTILCGLTTCTGIA